MIILIEVYAGYRKHLFPSEREATNQCLYFVNAVTQAVQSPVTHRTGMSENKVEHEDCDDIMIFMLEFMENNMPPENERRKWEQKKMTGGGGGNEWLESMMD